MVKVEGWVSENVKDVGSKLRLLSISQMWTYNTCKHIMFMISNMQLHIFLLITGKKSSCNGIKSELNILPYNSITYLCISQSQQITEKLWDTYCDERAELFFLYINIVIKLTIVFLDQMEHKDLEERSFCNFAWNLADWIIWIFSFRVCLCAHPSVRGLLTLFWKTPFSVSHAIPLKQPQTTIICSSNILI